jgi:DNA repair protein RadA/Sms
VTRTIEIDASGTAVQLGAFVCHACRNVTPQWGAWCRKCSYVGAIGFDPDARPSEIADDVPEVVDGPRAAGSIVPTEKLAIPTGLSGLDDVLTGGFYKEVTADQIRGSVIMLAGPRGSGKSRLLLAALSRPASAKLRCLYLTAEETAERLSMYVREGRLSPKIQIHETQEFETAMQFVEEGCRPTAQAGRPARVKQRQPWDLVVLDSAQKFRLDGTRKLSRISEAVRDFTKQHPTVIVLLSQENRAGDPAGSNELGHDVDVVLRVARDKDGSRLLTCEGKNRFGRDDIEWRYRIVEGKTGPYFETVPERPSAPMNTSPDTSPDTTTTPDRPIVPFPPKVSGRTIPKPPPIPVPPPKPPPPPRRPLSKHPGLHIVPRSDKS